MGLMTGLELGSREVKEGYTKRLDLVQVSQMLSEDANDLENNNLDFLL